MKIFSLIVGLLLSTHAIVAGSDEINAASIAEIKTLAPGITNADVQILSTPPLLVPLQRVSVRHAIFRPELKEWQLQLQCVPRSACLPFIVIVNSADRSLFRSVQSTSSATPLVRAGERKVMYSYFGSVRFRQYVTCLQSGRAGDSIRVRREGDHRILLAMVAPDGALIGRRAQ